MHINLYNIVEILRICLSSSWSSVERVGVGGCLVDSWLVVLKVISCGLMVAEHARLISSR